MIDEHLQPNDYADAVSAYALHALPPEEAQALEAFLAAHSDAQSDLASTEEAVAMLSYLVEPVPPPPQLRTRILAQVYADATLRVDAVPPGSVREQRTPIAFDSARTRRGRGMMWMQIAVAAVFLVVMIGFGSWVSVLQGNLSARDRVIAAQQQQIAVAGVGGTVAGTRPDVAARGELLRLSNPQTAVLTISGLPPLAQGKVYQVWFINGSTPTGAGIFYPGQDGTWRGVVNGDVARAQAVAISVEPDGGSPAPTGDIVAKGSL